MCSIGSARPSEADVVRRYCACAHRLLEAALELQFSVTSGALHEREEHLRGFVLKTVAELHSEGLLTEGDVATLAVRLLDVLIRPPRAVP